MRLSLILPLLALFVAGCGKPTEEEVALFFKGEHPGHEVVSVELAQDADAAPGAYRIKYRRPGDDRVHVMLWQYKRPKVDSVPVKDTASKPEPSA
jgi:hypothetical protein